MAKLKRIPFKKKKSIMHKGKEVFRTHAEAMEARKLMDAYVPLPEHYELVELCAANNTPKEEIVAYFGVDVKTFDKYFHDSFVRGRLRKNLKTTKTLFDMANGHEGIYDDKRKKFIVRPKAPDVTALIWWDKTRGGWREGIDLKAKGLAPVTNVVVFLPPNGREAGAGGDPQYVLREAAKVIEGTATEKKASR